jgi:glycosyltransferase involved in cell wall biosynthesis
LDIAEPRGGPERPSRPRSQALQAVAGKAGASTSGLKVAIFIDNFSATGVVTNAVAIAGRLNDYGCRVQLIASQARGALIDSVPDGVEVVGLLPPGPGDSSRRGRLRRSVLLFHRRLKAFRPDVLFSAGNHGHLVSALMSLTLPNCRTIVRISNDLDHLINGKPCRPFSRWWRVTKFRAVAALSDQIVFVSRHMLRSEAVLGSATIEKAIVIPNGVDAAAIRKRSNAPCNHAWLADIKRVPLVLSIGRFAQQKNLVNLVRAVAIARKSRPMRLLLIGSGPLKSALQEEAAKLGIAEAVDFVAPMPNPMPFLARASVMALPSWWEGSSNVLLEALACGTPVVASRTAGNAEDVLDFGRYGLLVDPGDPAGMAAALLSQVGGDVQFPGDRALDFDREAALDAYAELIMGQGSAVAGRASAGLPG